jgi:hypothetical protein
MRASDLWQPIYGGDGAAVMAACRRVPFPEPTVRLFRLERERADRFDPLLTVASGSFKAVKAEKFPINVGNVLTSTALTVYADRSLLLARNHFRGRVAVRTIVQTPA